MNDVCNSNETVREVCAEMNGNEFDEPHLNGDGIIGARILAKDWARRVLAAYEREMKRMHECCDALEDEFDAKDAEIARLKAALKPVMECASKSAEGSMPNYIGCWEAVREAQRIVSAWDDKNYFEKGETK